MKFRLLLALILLIGIVGGVSAQSDDASPRGEFPEITTTVNGETGEGYIYLANFARARPQDVSDEDWTNYTNYLLVVDNEGNIVFSKGLPRRGSHFRSFPDGTMIYHDLVDGGRGGGVGVDGPWYELDSNGDVIKEYRIIGYPTTALHEFIKRDNGNILFMTYDLRVVDMTEYGGVENGDYFNTVIQEITPDGEVVWEWSGWDYLGAEDTVRPEVLTREPPAPVDPIHSNSLAIDLDGNILLSSKHTDDIIKIDYETGDIIWRMGGPESKFNEFTFIDDPRNGFSSQHHPVILENGNLLLFDNGYAFDPQVSRAVEYEIDEENRTATLVWSYDNGTFAAGMGSVQRLENGNTVIGWGSAQGPAVSEVTPDGDVVFELYLPSNQISYRAYRLPFYGELPE